jgi:hypothetical protein
MTDWLPDPTPAERRAEERDTNIALVLLLSCINLRGSSISSSLKIAMTRKEVRHECRPC